MFKYTLMHINRWDMHKWKTENIVHWINNLSRQHTTSKMLNLEGIQKIKRTPSHSRETHRLNRSNNLLSYNLSRLYHRPKENKRNNYYKLGISCIYTCFFNKIDRNHMYMAYFSNIEYNITKRMCAYPRMKEEGERLIAYNWCSICILWWKIDSAITNMINGDSKPRTLHHLTGCLTI
jgi:hypothetical protein